MGFESADNEKLGFFYDNMAKIIGRIGIIFSCKFVRAKRARISRHFRGLFNHDRDIYRSALEIEFA